MSLSSAPWHWASAASAGLPSPPYILSLFSASIAPLPRCSTPTAPPGPPSCPHPWENGLNHCLLSKGFLPPLLTQTCSIPPFLIMSRGGWSVSADLDYCGNAGALRLCTHLRSSSVTCWPTTCPSTVTAAVETGPFLQQRTQMADGYQIMTALFSFLLSCSTARIY